jgi:cyclopropane fatty-acyl-phospholipid synthase-like methyltransferase
MKVFTNRDIADYYDQSEVHYRIFWALEKSLGLHYGIWDKNIHTLPEAVLNTNYRLMQLGKFSTDDRVLDAGCGVGGSAIYLAQNLNCKVHGISLSAKQIETAEQTAIQYRLRTLLQFSMQDYTQTNFKNQQFSKVWAVESMQTAPDKMLFFKEMYRILEPGGKICIADMFRNPECKTEKDTDMLTMLNGWAMSELLSVEEIEKIAGEAGFKVLAKEDVTGNVNRSVRKIYIASLAGAIGTWVYNTFIKKASYFSRMHYKTGIMQYKNYHKRKWKYLLLVLEKL